MARRHEPSGLELRGPPVLVRLVVLQYLLGDGELVDLGRSVDETHGPAGSAQRHRVGDTEGAVDVGRLRPDIGEDFGRQHLGRRNVLAYLRRRGLIDEPGRVHDKEAELLDLHPRVGDPDLDRLLVGEQRPLCIARERPLAHHVEHLLGTGDRPHGVVDAAATQPSLGYLKGVSLAPEQVLYWDTYVLVAHVGVATVVPVLVAQAEVVQHVDPRRCRSARGTSTCLGRGKRQGWSPP